MYSGSGSGIGGVLSITSVSISTSVVSTVVPPPKSAKSSTFSWYLQLPSSLFAYLLKFTADLSVQPNTTAASTSASLYLQLPSFSFALGL